MFLKFLSRSGHDFIIFTECSQFCVKKDLFVEIKQDKLGGKTFSQVIFTIL